MTFGCVGCKWFTHHRAYMDKDMEETFDLAVNEWKAQNETTES